MLLRLIIIKKLVVAALLLTVAVLALWRLEPATQETEERLVCVVMIFYGVVPDRGYGMGLQPRARAGPRAAHVFT